MLRQQRTILRRVNVCGIGYWSGEAVRLEFRPAAVNSGIRFVRSDLASPVAIPADVAARIEMPRRTTLAMSDVTVEMVEHVLAALSGLQIDNCEVWTDRCEMPGADGSSKLFAQALTSSEIVEQPAICEPLVVTEPLMIGDTEKFIKATPLPTGSENLICRYDLDYSAHPAIGQQSLEIEVTPESFQTELASARTFVLEEEAAEMHRRGIGTHVSPQDLLVFGKTGPIDNTLRFRDECVRHKLLDVVGDLALIGRPVIGHIHASRSGHYHNAELAKALLAVSAKRSKKGKQVA